MQQSLEWWELFWILVTFQWCHQHSPERTKKEMYKKSQQWMHFLRMLNRFEVCSKLMSMFYNSIVESVLTFAIISWFGNLSLGDKKRLEHIVKVASKIIGVTLPDVLTIYHRRVNSKAQDILQCSDHPLHAEFELLPSGRRFRLPKSKSNRLKNSFITQAITQLNSNLKK